MDEAMGYIQKDVSILLEPEIAESRNPERSARKILPTNDIDRVKILRNPKIKVPGSDAVPYTASILTILVLAYKYVNIVYIGAIFKDSLGRSSLRKPETEEVFENCRNVEVSRSW